MARRPPTMVIQEDYIDMDLTPRVRVQSSGGSGASKNHKEGAYVSASPLHLPPRLPFSQKLLQEQEEIEEAPPCADAAALGAQASNADTGDDSDAKTCTAKKYSWSKRLKLMKQWTSREYIRSLLSKPSDIGFGNGGGIRRAGSVLDQELCSHRRSFSGIIRWVRLVVSGDLATMSSSSSSSSTPSCRITDGFFHRSTPALKRSSSARSEKGAIEGAIAHCKRSHHQQGKRSVGSVADVVFYSVNNTPRVSSVAAAAASKAVQERQELMCRG